VFWWLEEGWEDVVWVCSEAEAVVRAVVAEAVVRAVVAEAVVRAVVADFFFYRWHVEIALDNSVRHIPWWVHDLT
jgi:hypothetical protein